LVPVLRQALDYLAALYGKVEPLEKFEAELPEVAIEK